MIAGIIGAAGYAGAELVRLLSGHEKVSGFSLGSVSMEGDRIENIYPNFLGRVSLPLVKPEEVVTAIFRHYERSGFATLPAEREKLLNL